MEVTLDTIRDIQIYQPKDGYRFSVDALILSSFVDLPIVKSIADLGAGSGIIGILLAKKYPRSKVLLIELQDSLARLADENILINHLEKRVAVLQRDMRDLIDGGTAERSGFGGTYDLVVSNPPFRKLKTGLLSPDQQRAIARHEIELTLSELAGTAQALLRSRGRLFLIHHPGRLSDIIKALGQRGMEPKRLRFVHSGPSSEAKMVLIEAVKQGRAGLKVERPLYIHDADGAYSTEAYELCKGVPE